MGFESNSISIPFHWSGGILAITIVVSIILVGTGFYIASLNWPTVMLWLKYLLIIVFFIAIIVGVGYMPIRLKADNGKIMVKKLIRFAPNTVERGGRGSPDFEVRYKRFYKNFRE